MEALFKSILIALVLIMSSYVGSSIALKVQTEGLRDSLNKCRESN